MKYLKYLLTYLPTALPVGTEEFNTWADSILRYAKCPDNDSTRFALAVMILHCNSTESRKPKQYFIRCLNKAAANEIANDIAQGFKRKQQAEQEAKIKADIERANLAKEQANELSQDSQVQKAE